jgi:hypothetical protein
VFADCPDRGTTAAVGGERRSRFARAVMPIASKADFVRLTAGPGSRRGGEWPSALPSSFSETLDHVGVIFRSHPRDAIADIHVELGRRSGYCLFKDLVCLL